MASKQAILFVIQAGVLAAIKLGLEECWIGRQGLRTQEFSLVPIDHLQGDGKLGWLNSLQRKVLIMISYIIKQHYMGK